MKKELLKLQARNREIQARLGEMYDKAESEKREFNAEEAREERELKHELESNHREIMNSCDAAAIGALREQQDKSAQLREFFKAQPSCVSSSRLSRRSARTLPPS